VGVLFLFLLVCELVCFFSLNWFPVMRGEHKAHAQAHAVKSSITSNAPQEHTHRATQSHAQPRLEVNARVRS
jgi:hypothetical protein